MKNVFINTIVFVKDIEVSKDFYTNILGMKIMHDYGTVVFFENHFVLHIADSILKTVYKTNKESALKRQGKNNLLLYFETDQLEELYNQIADKVELIHGIEKQAWGQRVFRFYDPDKHIVEFGEPLRTDNLTTGATS